MQEESEYGRAMRAKNVQVHGGKSTPVRREPLDDNSRRTRTVTKVTDSGAVATVTNRNDEKGDHQDVHVRTPTVVGKVAINR